MSTERDNSGSVGAASSTGTVNPVVSRKPKPAAGAAPRARPLKLRVHSWLRWLHIYISMFSLLAILFFALTGITLNHPDWAFTNAETKTELKGQLPSGWKKGQTVDWFRVTEYLRQANGVRGAAQDTESDATQGSLTFKAPGYSADCFFDIQTGRYELSVTAQGFTGVMNDFHRGSEAGATWRWLIDVSGLCLALVALTGLGLLVYLKKIRVAAFAVMGAGAVIVWLLMKLGV